MRSILTLLAILLSAGNALADDLLTMVFDKTTIKVDGKDENARMYYVLIGKNNKLEDGTILQLTQLMEDPDHYGFGSGQFQLDQSNGELTIFWESNDPNEVGQEEHVRIHDGSSKNRRVLETTSHDDEPQVGQKQGVRLVDFRSLPDWAREACQPYILESLPPAERLRLAREDAALRELEQEIRMQHYRDLERWYKHSLEILNGQ